MSALCCHSQRTGPVHGKILLAEDHGVDVIFVDRRIGPAVGQCVLRSFCERQEHFVRLLHINRSACFVRDLRLCKHDLHFFRIGNVHDDLSVLERSRHDINAFFRDRHSVSVDQHCGGIRCAAALRQHDLHALRFIVRSVQIPVRKQFRHILLQDFTDPVSGFRQRLFDLRALLRSCLQRAGAGVSGE